jgi:hypothetical protein
MAGLPSRACFEIPIQFISLEFSLIPVPRAQKLFVTAEAARFLSLHPWVSLPVANLPMNNVRSIPSAANTRVE